MKLINNWFVTLPDNTEQPINSQMLDLLTDDVKDIFKQYSNDCMESYLSEQIADSLNAIDIYCK